MIQMKWTADSENSENSALDTIIVSHKIYEKKYFLIGLTLLRRIEQLNTLLVNQVNQVNQGKRKRVAPHQVPSSK